MLAIACGVVEGRGLGQNARAALIARGFAEMTRFGLAMGARRETLAGLCGLGDLVLTCSSTASRNFSLGKAIGEGRDAAALMADRRTVAEGAHHRAGARPHRAASEGIDMPIVAAVDAAAQGRGAGRTGARTIDGAPAAARGALIHVTPAACRRPVKPVAIRNRPRCPF